ncbi:MAG: DUF6529 family protein [Desulfobulbaceae bacterium]|nr:DUF6529 family protein [Desulfobulbaceae bacterium]
MLSRNPEVASTHAGEVMDTSVWQFLPITPTTKTYLAFVLVVLSLFEFLTAMKLFGSKGPHAGAMTIMRLHRVMGYVFGVYFAFISWICLDLMARLATAGNYQLDARGALHGLLAFTLFGTLLLKISFIRVYRNYRPYVPLLGIIVAVGTVVLWCFAGWMFLFLVGKTETVALLLFR